MSSKPIKVIIDLDTGFDDAWALFLLLKAHINKTHQILAITCVNGNTTVENIALNVQRCILAFEQEFTVKISIPIYKGSTESLLNKYQIEGTPFHGFDGLCDVLTDTPTEKNLQPGHAIIALSQMINEHPNEVTLICMGPLTNLAMAMKFDSKISDKIRELFIMGGNHLGRGNTTSCGEFNFYMDPEAAHIVLEKAKCQVTIATWEATAYPTYKVPWDWRINVLGALGGPIVKLMNRIEERRLDYNGSNGWELCDAVLVGCFLMGEKLVKRSSEHWATVELGGFHTRGQLVLDHLRKMSPNVVVVEEINCQVFQDLILWIFSNADV